MVHEILGRWSLAFVKFPEGSLIPKWLRTLVCSCGRTEVGLEQRRVSGRVELEYGIPGLVLVRQRKLFKFDFC